MDKEYKWNSILNYSKYENLILSKIPKKNTNYDLSHIIKEYKIDIIIDLYTDHDFYDIPPEIIYHKFICEKKKIPSQDCINKINTIIKNYKNENYILIHCHYGFNRTGYIFISYLCSKGINLETAMNIFKEIRGKGIKYPELLESLQNKYS